MSFKKGFKMRYQPSYTPARNLSFRVESMYMKRPGLVGRVKPNEHGVYCGLPMMVLGETTQQNTYYEPQSVVEQITDPNSRLNKVLVAGKLQGEWGHPSFTSDMSREDQLTRLTTVIEKNQCHLFTALYTDAPNSQGHIVIRGDIKPMGPYGSYLKESLDDPVANTAFSLRAFVDTQVDSSGIKRRKVRALTTFDAVGASGYATTDKAHAIGLESFSSDNYDDYEIHVMKDGNLLINQIALETFTNTELNELFGVSSISKIIQSKTFVETDKSLMEKYPSLYIDSVFHDIVKG